MSLGFGILKSKAGWVGWFVGVIMTIASYLIGSTTIDDALENTVEQKDEFILENPVSPDGI